MFSADMLRLFTCENILQ